MRYSLVAAAIVGAQLVAGNIAQAQQPGGKCKLIMDPNSGPKMVYALPPYTSLASLEVFCKGSGSAGVKVAFKGPPPARLKVSLPDVREGQLLVGPDGVLTPNDTQVFVLIFEGAIEAAKKLRSENPSAPVVAEAMVGDVNVNADDMKAVSDDFNKACGSYVPGAAAGSPMFDPRLYRSWVASNRQYVVNFNAAGDWLAIEVATQRRSSGKYKADGSTLSFADMRCGYRFDQYGNLVVSNCNWAGTPGMPDQPKCRSAWVGENRLSKGLMVPTTSQT